MKVLLVDDEVISNFLHTSMLQQIGYTDEIDTALNGKEAIQMVSDATTLPDIILLDINMPIMNGFEFLEELQKLRLNSEKDIHISIISSSSHPVDLERAKKFGITNYLVKPITEDDMRSVFTEQS